MTGEGCTCGHERGLHSDTGRWCSGPDRSDEWGVCRCGGFTAATTPRKDSTP